MKAEFAKDPLNLWYDIPGYDGKYQASRLGEIRRVYKSGKVKVLSQFTKCSARTNRKRPYVKITFDGKGKTVSVLSLMVKTFFDAIPDGKVPYHINMVTSDNHLENIGFITRKELGRLSALQADKRKSVVKIDQAGNVIEIYRSVREAGRQNNMSYQTISDRCHNRVKNPFALDGYNYQFEDKFFNYRE